MPDYELCKRFELSSGQFFTGKVRLKNQRWYLDGVEFGYGDLRDVDITKIMEYLEEGEMFEGYPESHMTLFQYRENPNVRIFHNSIHFPDEISMKPVQHNVFDQDKEGEIDGAD
jgi:hypothetical protein